MNDDTTHYVGDRQWQRLERRFGVHVRAWLAELPATLDELAEKWRFTVRKGVPYGRTSVVVPVTLADGREGVLKLSPDNGLAVSEAQLLRIWADSWRVPRVWGLDRDRGAILMEHIDGDTVADKGVVLPMESIGSLMTDLHAIEVDRAQLVELRPLMARVQYVFDQCSHARAEGPAAEVVPASMLHQGYSRGRDLAHGTVNVVPVHGDLHPGNVIDGGERGLVALDPRACAGDGAVDAVDWVLWKATTVGEMERRVSALSRATNVDGERLMEWARAFAPCLAVAKVNRGHGGTAEFEALMELSEAALAAR